MCTLLSLNLNELKKDTFRSLSTHAYTIVVAKRMEINVLKIVELILSFLLRHIYFLLFKKFLLFSVNTHKIKINTYCLFIFDYF